MTGMRFSYIANPPEHLAQLKEDISVMQRVRARRGVLDLLDLNRGLLHSPFPAIADGWQPRSYPSGGITRRG